MGPKAITSQVYKRDGPLTKKIAVEYIPQAK